MKPGRTGAGRVPGVEFHGSARAARQDVDQGCADLHGVVDGTGRRREQRSSKIAAAVEMGRGIASDYLDQQVRGPRSRKKRGGAHDRLVVRHRVMAIGRQLREKLIDARRIPQPDLQVEHPTGIRYHPPCAMSHGTRSAACIPKARQPPATIAA